jgi:molybdopterin-guanine dinucleotide biosynthesis protein A
VGESQQWAALVLTGGTGARMGGADKAHLEVDGASLLERALVATAAATEVVVVGDPVPTSRPVTWAREEPPGGGPAAGLLAGLDTLADDGPALVAVLAVDMPLVSATTFDRLTDALAGAADDPDGALLVDDAGHRQLLCGVYRTAALHGARPADRSAEHGLPVRRLLGPLRLVEVPALAEEARDVDTWDDLRAVRGRSGPPAVDRRGAAYDPGSVELHAWVTRLMADLGLEGEIDEGLVLDVAREAAHNVLRPAAPVSTYLLGYAAALAGGRPEDVERLAARVVALAAGWQSQEERAEAPTDEPPAPPSA